MDNKIYTCALCGKSYDSVIERSRCEQKCYAKQQEEANKKELEKINRKQTILKKYEKVDDNNKNESHSAELPEDISNMFKGMMKTMLTKNQNK